MRKVLWMGLALASALVVSSCNSGPTGPVKGYGETTGTGGQTGQVVPNNKKIKLGIVFDTGGIGDQSFNDSAWRGAQRCQNELGVEVMKVESTKEADYTTNLQAMANAGCDIVVGVGITMRSAIEQAAKDSPNTKFVSIDGEPLAGMDNVRTIQFKEEEGSFLVGYVAGLVSKTHKIGFVGGMDMPLIHKFQFGYMAGAKTANKDTEILPAKYTGDWVNTDKAKVAAELLYGSGADIVYHAAGKAGLGVISAAKDKNLWAIGVDSDQDGVEPGHVLTSMIKHVDEGVFQTVKDFKDGKFTPGAVVYDLKSGGVGTSDFKYTKDVIGAENLQKLDAVKARIVNGEIKVPNDEASYNAYLQTLK